MHLVLTALNLSNIFNFLVRTLIRLVLVLKYKTGIQHYPPIPPLNRKVDIPKLCEGNKMEVDGTPKNLEVTFTLQHSGRMVRTLEAGIYKFFVYSSTKFYYPHICPILY